MWNNFVVVPSAIHVDLIYANPVNRSAIHGDLIYANPVNRTPEKTTFGREHWTAKRGKTVRPMTFSAEK